MILVQDWLGDTIYDITGFKRITINDKLRVVRESGLEDNNMLFSIEVCFFYNGGKEGTITLGMYGDYETAHMYLMELLKKIAEGNTFISMVPTHDIEIEERDER